MTYMEIATYLGMLAVGLSQSDETDKTVREMNEKMRQACCEAQLTMFELAKRELEKQR